jgi:hypothetical protein
LIQPNAVPPGSPTAMHPIERYRLGREAGES